MWFYCVTRHTVCDDFLVENAAEGSEYDPKYSARVLTAAVKVQKEHHQKMKAKLQLMMEQLVQSQGPAESSSPTPIPLSEPQHYPLYTRTYNNGY